MINVLRLLTKNCAFIAFLCALLPQLIYGSGCSWTELLRAYDDKNGADIVHRSIIDSRYISLPDGHVEIQLQVDLNCTNYGPQMCPPLPPESFPAFQRMYSDAFFNLQTLTTEEKKDLDMLSLFEKKNWKMDMLNALQAQQIYSAIEIKSKIKAAYNQKGQEELKCFASGNHERQLTYFVPMLSRQHQGSDLQYTGKKLTIILKSIKDQPDTTKTISSDKKDKPKRQRLSDMAGSDKKRDTLSSDTPGFVMPSLPTDTGGEAHEVPHNPSLKFTDFETLDEFLEYVIVSGADMLSVHSQHMIYQSNSYSRHSTLY